MAAGKTSLRLCALALFIACSACGEGEIRESTFSIEGFCAFAPQVAIVVEVYGAGDAKVDRVTATRKREELCFLERGARDDDAGEPEAALYSCLAQGEGSYELRVTSGKRTATQTIDVAGDECRAKMLQRVRFDLD